MADSDKPIKVFIAEDQAVTAAGLRLLLAELTGLNIVGDAADGPSAVAGVLDLEPDVVLMDSGLPGIDGVEATQQITDNEARTRIMMMTSTGTGVDIMAALRAGALGLCSKGVSRKQLEQAIRSLAEGAAWLDPSFAKDVLQAAGSAICQEDAELKSCPLSPREGEILKLVAEGLSNGEIAERLVVSPETVKTHLRRIMEKLNVHDRTQAVVKAIREKLLDPCKSSHSQVSHD